MRLKKWVGVVGIGFAVLASGCGGGGGGGGGGGDASANQSAVDPAPTPTPTPASSFNEATNIPGAKIDVQSAVLNSSVTAQDANLTKTGDFIFAASSGNWVLGQIFVYDKRIYKILGTTPTANGGINILTEHASLQEAFTSLNISVQTHAVAYDENGNALTASQFASSRSPNILQRALNSINFLSEKPKAISGFSLNCFYPKKTLQAEIGDSKDVALGYEYEFNCGLGEFMGGTSIAEDVVTIVGKYTNTTKYEYIFKLEEGTEYNKQSTITEIKDFSINFSATSQAQRLTYINNTVESRCKKLAETVSGKCSLDVDKSTGALKGEISSQLYSKDFGIPIPTTPPITIPMKLELGVSLSLEVDIHGDVKISPISITRIVKQGKENNIKIDEDKPSTAGSAPFEVTGSFDGTAEIALQGYGSLGVAKTIGKSELSLAKGKLSLGPFVELEGKLLPTGATACSGIKGGIKTGLEFVFFETSWFKGVTFTPYEAELVLVSKGNCETSKIELSYVLDGKIYYVYNPEESAKGTNLDVYDAEPGFVMDKTKPRTIQLNSTRGIPGKELSFDVEVLDVSSGVTAQYVKTINNITGEQSNVIQVFPGNIQPGQTIRLKLKAFDPNEREKTEVSRTVWVKLGAEVSATPVAYISSQYNSKSEYFNKRLNDKYNISRNIVDPKSEIHGGVFTFNNSNDVFKFEKDDGYTYSTVDAYPLPKKIGLITKVGYSRSGWDAPAQFFDVSIDDSTVYEYVFVAERSAWNVRQRSDVNSSQSVKKGNTLVIEVAGRGMPAEIPLSVPACSGLREIMPDSSSDWPVKDYQRSTSWRIYTCTASLANASNQQAVIAGAAIVSNTFSVAESNSILGDAVDWVVGFGKTLGVWLDRANRLWSDAVSVIWNFGDSSADAITNQTGVRTAPSHQYATTGTFVVTANYYNSDNTLLGSDHQSVAVQASTGGLAGVNVAYISGALNDSGSIHMPVANGESTSDTTPVLTGTLSVPLNSAQAGSVQNLNIYDGNTRLNPAATVTGQTWVFTPGAPLTPGLHTFTAQVEVNTVPVAGSRSAPFALTIAAIPVVSDIQPKTVVRGTSYSFNVTGSDLPTSGITVTVPDDARASCQTPNNMTTTGFGLACQFYKMGARTLHVNAGGKELGTVSVSVNSNVTGVSWTSPSTTSSGTVKFGETVRFTVRGTDLTVDEPMGFAVTNCGVSNTEDPSVKSSISRTFTCNFNNQAGAVAGQMTGVVKDQPDTGAVLGQVLYGGPGNVVAAFKVPVEVAQIPVSTSKLPHSGITANQCYAAGSHALGACSGAASTLNAQQDGHRASINAMAYSKIGFNGEDLADSATSWCAVKDKVTGLVWQNHQAAPATYTNWGDSRAGDASKYAADNVTLCGSAGWRLPTVDELQSIVDYGKPDPGPTNNTAWFPNTPGSGYWSSSTSVSGSGGAWSVNFGFGFVGHNNRNVGVFHVRLVRASQ